MQINLDARNESVSVGVTPVVVSSEVPSRKLIYLRNISVAGQVLTISFGTSASAGNGIKLNPDEFFLDSSMGDYAVYNGTISAISDLAGGLLGVVEL